MSARNYLAHTVHGASIRVLARQAGCHASTVLRRIRRVELRRDDPLVDQALRDLAVLSLDGPLPKLQPKDSPDMQKTPQPSLPDQDLLEKEALRVLRRLAENGAVLAVAGDMDKAVVVRDIAGGGSARTAVVAAEIARAMALQNWIAPLSTGRVTRYQITAAGRSKLEQLLQRSRADLDAGEGLEAGWEEAPAPRGPSAERRRRMRQCIAESPLSALARRKDKTGKPFLSDGLVQAGERLREDFELAQMESRTTQNWDHFLTDGNRGQAGIPSGAGPTAASEARARVARALSHLGPGLSDVVLRCCCYLEGLETTEKRLGWSARSGKVVLRIALIRLKRHYDETIGPNGPMIG